MLTEPKLTIHASNDNFLVSSDMTEPDQDGLDWGQVFTFTALDAMRKSRADP